MQTEKIADALRDARDDLTEAKVALNHKHFEIVRLQRRFATELSVLDEPMDEERWAGFLSKAAQLRVELQQAEDKAACIETSLKRLDRMSGNEGLQA
ncbi:hypothetical protein [Xiamenia xianingshaonis]|uniref:Uncharacterized protein n=1 Tax=Xiamenia xianingshaonis TaxID=2682776 RepID=A0ABX0II77_9ACTN|nr:hypothetical protein [Xiamenia xianingshaonis]NHM13506.1 hypothetical protein [Xiamenia xianingshaonis]